MIFRTFMLSILCSLACLCFVTTSFADTNMMYSNHSQFINDYNQHIHKQSKENNSNIDLTQKNSQDKSNLHSNYTYAIAYFFSSECQFCQRFSPVLSEFANVNHVKVYAFSVDGKPLPSFSNFIYPSQKILNHFFGDIQSVVFPTVFLVNVNTNKFVKISTGYIAYNQFSSLFYSFLKNPSVHSMID